MKGSKPMQGVDLVCWRINSAQRNMGWKENRVSKGTH